MLAIFVGEAPSTTGKGSKPFDGQRADGRKAPNGSGWRLARLLGTTPEAMHARADWRFVNLFESPQAKWDADAAYVAAIRVCAKLLPTSGYVALVLLGQKVARAFNGCLPFFVIDRWINWKGLEGVYVVVPHPSGLNRAWNDKNNRAKFRRVMRQMQVLS